MSNLWNYSGVWSSASNVTWPATMATTTTPLIYGTWPPQPVPSAGHVPDYEPAAEDPVVWLRRRINEVTDLFPAAA